MKTEDTEALGR